MKIFIGALVGGIIIFITQFLSWTVLDLHRPAMQYTANQDEIISYLSTKFDSSAGYALPTLPPGASNEEMQSLDEKMKGKPWALIQYHKSYDASMVMNMIKNLITNILIVLFFCWVLSGYTANSFGKTFLAAIFTGFIIFLQSSYVMHIWYDSFDLQASFTDYLVSWALTGIWLGWWLNKKKVG